MSHQPLIHLLLLGLVTVDQCAPQTVLPPSNNGRPSVDNNINNRITTTTTTTSPPATSAKPVVYLWNKEEYPNPLQSPKFCQRTQQSLLCDPDEVLTREQADKLDQLMNGTSNSSKCYCPVCPDGGNGIKVGIALAQHIYKGYNAPGDASQEFANHVRHRWQYGTCDNTILILLVTKETEITISMGAVAESIFNEQFFSGLIMAHRGEFEQGRFYEGLVALIGGIRTTLHANKAPTTPDLGAGGGGAAGPDGARAGAGGEPGSSSSTAVAVIGIIAGFLLLVLVLTGTILFAKRRYESTETSTDPLQHKPSGYFTRDGKRKTRRTDGEEGDEDYGDDEDEEGGDEPAPPLPNSQPPSTPSTGSIRRASAPNGQTVEYEPVSIEDPDQQRPGHMSSEPHQRAAPENARHSMGGNGPDADGVGHLHGHDEILDQSAHISTPDLSSRL